MERPCPAASHIPFTSNMQVWALVGGDGEDPELVQGSEPLPALHRQAWGRLEFPDYNRCTELYADIVNRNCFICFCEGIYVFHRPKLGVAKQPSGAVCRITWFGYGLPGYGNESLNVREVGVDENQLEFEFYLGGDSDAHAARIGAGPEMRHKSRARLYYGDEISLYFIGGKDTTGLRLIFQRPEMRPKTTVEDAFNEDYVLEEFLGQGKFGGVYRAIYQCGPNKETYAVKVVRKKLGEDEEDLVAAHKEVRAMKQLPYHENIVQIKDMFICHQDYKIVMEFIDGMTLEKHLGNTGAMAEPTVREFMRQLCSGLAFMHAHGVVHRDIKLDNILVTSSEPPILKIIDFGMAKLVTNGEQMKTYCGPSGYYPPEICDRQGNGLAPYTNKVDSWYAGTIMFDLFTNMGLRAEVLKNRAPDDMAWADRLTITEFPSHLLKEQEQKAEKREPLSDDGISFLGNLLCQSPEERMSLADALDHPWLKQSTATSSLSCVKQAGLVEDGSPYTEHRAHVTRPGDTELLKGSSTATGSTAVHLLPSTVGRTYSMLASEDGSQGYLQHTIMVEPPTDNVGVSSRFSSTGSLSSSHAELLHTEPRAASRAPQSSFRRKRDTTEEGEQKDCADGFGPKRVRLSRLT